jgi:tRNA(Ile)-lysidine synthase TilS/MesJ
MTPETLQLLSQRLLTTRYRKTIWHNFLSGIKQFGLLKENDCVAVCISGGKDSLLLAMALSLLQQRSEYPFTVKYLSLDPGYTEENRNMVAHNIEKLGLPVHTVHADILKNAEASSSPCHVCAAMRRGYLYKNAKLMGCNKIALGHHYDDVVETVLMSILFGGEFKTMMPKVRSQNYEGMELIRPLYLVREKDIFLWRDAMDLKTLSCACSVTRSEEGGARKVVKDLLKDLHKKYPVVYRNVFASTKGVKLKNVLSYQDYDGNLLSYLTEYQDE